MGQDRDYIVHDDEKILGFFGEYRFLSNFHIAEVYYEGILYPSTEHAYQAAKSNDISQREKFLTLTCGGAKKLGQTIVLRENWDIIKYDIMFLLVFDKFTRHPDLREKLISTGKKYLEETNHWKDHYYGVCDGKGLNVLGNILMYVRDIINKNPNRKGFIL